MQYTLNSKLFTEMINLKFGQWLPPRSKEGKRMKFKNYIKEDLNIFVALFLKLEGDHLESIQYSNFSVCDIFNYNKK